MPSPVSWISRAAVLADRYGIAFTGTGGIGRLPRRTWHRIRTDAFGADPRGERLARIRRSPQFRDGAFQNPIPTRRLAAGYSPLSVGRAQLAGDRTRRVPAAPVPMHRLGPADLADPPASGLRLTWLCHATVLAELDGRRVLFDPVWGERCSPFSWTGPKRLHPMPVEDADLEAAAAAYAATLARVAGAPAVLDVVHLGLGADGHTASLVPGDPILGRRDVDVAPTARPYQGTRRLSLTFPALERARGVVWLVTGPDKAEALARLLAADASIPAGRVPQARALTIAVAGDVLGKVAKLRSRDLAP